ncbi:MAG: ABC transporter permease [Oscillospiraceae bacterium]|nr:ABC transporter permease [Oscillospiraceae bacterium]
MQKKKSFFRKNVVFTIFAVLAILVILTAVFAPVICGERDPYEGDLAQSIMKPSAEHPFGTDKMGRDVFTRVLYGARVSLLSTFILVAVIFVLGAILGVVAGYFGGAVDAVIMRIADMMIAFPGLVLAIAVAGILGASIRNAIIAITIVSWPKYARLARSLVMKIRHTDFVAAATVTGSKTMYMLRRYMFPNTLTTLVITAATDIGSMMMELAALSFLGFGAKAPTPEWGYMLSEGRNFMQNAPWMMIFPGLAIFITVVIFNMLGDGLRDILDVRSE